MSGDAAVDKSLLKTAAIGFLAPVVLLAPFQNARAGFLDWLFGRRPAAVSAPAHPEVTVSAASKRPKKKRAAALKAPPVPALTPQEQLARTIDPDKTPDWHLVDPTLRRGDVLFLKDRVVVFMGGEPGKPGAYMPVSQTRLFTARERRLFAAMARDRAGPPRPTRIARAR
ncbi:hypothetical protein HNR47_001184 [Methylopila jiangsuensis]|uniref:hypothetical protein n=1 Tax=Methylopila jiangsuensis TaxID=586230 RepID=UPI0022F3039A|nr:hypothetical protein [Methylopila jiangsuensis]MDR6285201.1 hypothetical protein [Methylopila jiangsuensis]